jgi:hypothetical protein
MRAVILLAAALASPARAQVVPPAAAPADAPLRVFFDCRAFCDFDYIRTEMDFVDYVRNREDADIHILVTTQSTGTGGSEYTLNFIGQRAFTQVNDTLRFAVAQTDTDDMRRQALVRVLKVGTMHFIAATPMAARMDIELAREEAPGPGAPGGQVRDPWNFWVFSVGVDGSIEGESQQETREVSLDLSANRTTENWKVQFGLDGSYEDERFEIEDDEAEDSVRTVLTLRRSYEFDFLLVKSLGAHLSAGMEGSVESNTFGNERFSWRIAPAIEYNVFPYAESTRRVFTIRYGLGISSFDWREVTVFGETEETRPAHALSAGFATNRPWGETSLAVDLSQYLHDTSKYRLEFSGDIEIQLFRGLSFDAGGSYARVHDQLSIPARGATPDEIFLRLRELRTSYEFETRIGISYRFGSIFNNVVNPRFRRNDFD